jgi:hypothetical protein
MTKILSTHWLRRTARAEERRLQAWLDALETAGLPDDARAGVLTDHHLPEWTRGVRVESAGRFQHAVVATSTRGR